MKVVISGYGRMGKTVEKVCRERGHEIVAIVDCPGDWEKLALPSGTVVIDFSLPGETVDNMARCFRRHLPVVVGTTGWYEHLEKVKKACDRAGGTLFYAPNFSLGVNILFYLNRKLASIMATVEGYRASVSETHHIHKLDAPSGTALKLAKDILSQNPALKTWKNKPDDSPEVLPVISHRRGEVPGMHEVVYESDADILSLKHEAKNRKGFALGAVLAAEFILGKQGVFTMDDYLKTLGL